jgi:hypothetical protein
MALAAVRREIIQDAACVVSVDAFDSLEVIENHWPTMVSVIEISWVVPDNGQLMSNAVP